MGGPEYPLSEYAKFNYPGIVNTLPIRTVKDNIASQMPANKQYAALKTSLK